MLSRAKSWLINKLGGNTEPVVPVEVEAKPRLREMSRALQRAADSVSAADRPPFRKYKAPDLPPGVVPKTIADHAQAPPPGLFLAHDEVPRTMAMDFGGAGAANWDWLNSFNGAGFCGLGYPGYPYLSELTQISEYRSPSEVLSTETTRKWGEFVSKDGGDKSDQITKMHDEFERLKVRDAFRRASLQDGFFGRSQIMLNIKGQESDVARQKPLMVAEGGLGVGGLLSIQVVEPYWSTPYSWNSTHPEKEDFYVPESWYIMGRKTHATRLLTFIAREVPDILKPAYNFGGISMSQLMEPYVNFWLRTRKSVNDLINIFSITVLSTDLSTSLQDDSTGGGLLARAQAFTQMRANKGLAVINKNSEEIVQVNTPLGTLDKLQAQAQEHMAAPCHIPLIKLFGIVPTGLNSDGGEGEMSVWYDFVHAYQENVYGANMKIMSDAVQLTLFGAIDDDIVWKWAPMSEPTVKELSEIRTADAGAITSLITAGVVAPEEAREKLQQDPESGWDNLNGPAPEPPQDGSEDGEGSDFDPEGAEHEAGLQGAEHEHTSEEADKDREHESKENDKDRKHAMALQKAKPKPKLAKDGEPDDGRPFDHEEFEDGVIMTSSDDPDEIAMDSGKFTEALHPRDNKGKFGAGGASLAGSSSAPKSVEAVTPAVHVPAQAPRMETKQDDSVTAKPRKGYPFRVTYKFHREGDNHQRSTTAPEWLMAKNFKSREEAEAFVKKLEKKAARKAKGLADPDPYNSAKYGDFETPVEVIDMSDQMPGAVIGRQMAEAISRGHNPAAIPDSIAHLREPSVKAAEEFAEKLIEGYKAKLAAHNWNVREAFPLPLKPNGREMTSAFGAQGDEIKKIEAKRSFALSITEHDETASVGLPRRASAGREAAMVKQWGDEAEAQFTAYQGKLAEKIGDVASATLSGNSVWHDSTINVVKPDGSKESWHTQQILNQSVYGKLFNQYPTRKLK